MKVGRHVMAAVCLMWSTEESQKVQRNQRHMHEKNKCEWNQFWRFSCQNPCLRILQSYLPNKNKMDLYLKWIITLLFNMFSDVSTPIKQDKVTVFFKRDSLTFVFQWTRTVVTSFLLCCLSYRNIILLKPVEKLNKIRFGLWSHVDCDRFHRVGFENFLYFWPVKTRGLREGV